MNRSLQEGIEEWKSRMPFGKVGMKERMKELHIDRNGENGYLCGTYDLCILITELQYTFTFKHNENIGLRVRK